MIRIGVDYSEGLHKNIEIVVLDGVKAIRYVELEGFEINELPPILENLCKTYNGIVVFENNRHSLFLAMSKFNLTHLLVDERKDSLFNKGRKGITYCQPLKDLWNFSKDIFEYDERFENAVRIAALHILTNENNMAVIRTLKEINRQREYYISELKSL